MNETQVNNIVALVVADLDSDAESLARTVKSLEYANLRPAILSSTTLGHVAYSDYDKSYFDPNTQTISAAINGFIQHFTEKHILIIAAGTIFPRGTKVELENMLESNPASVLRLRTRVVRPIQSMTQAELNELILATSNSRTDSVASNRNSSTAAIVVPRERLHFLCGFKPSLREFNLTVDDFLKRCRKFGISEKWLSSELGVYTLAARMNKRRESRPVATPGEAPDSSLFGDLENWVSQTVGTPLVSIVISTYNRADYIADCLYSIQSQTVQNFEVILVDDGSTDNTSDVVASFDDPRIRYFRRSNAGISASRNFGARQSRGHFIAVHDDDDIMLPWRLECQLKSLAPGDHGSFGVSVHFDHDTGEMHRLVHRLFNIQTALRYGNNPTHPTWLIRADIFRQFEYDETLKSGVDNNVAMRMIRSGVRMRHTGESLILRRLHGGQITRSAGEIQQASAKLSQRMLKFANGAAEDPANTHTSEEWLSGLAADTFEKSVRPYLPDHLVERQVLTHVRSTASDDEYRDVLPNTAGVRISRQARHQGDWTTARLFSDVTWRDMATLRKAGIDFSAVEGPVGTPIDAVIKTIGAHVADGRSDCTWVMQSTSPSARSAASSDKRAEVVFTVVDQVDLKEGVQKLQREDRAGASAGDSEPFLVVRAATDLGRLLGAALKNSRRLP
ncbi:glycosyltransferase family A protein [Pseudarthrobacter sp. IC2-21]|uniref:glycosyltransferase family 2 protein n=1 Tax=Pseudarthrobacter sp. IC2-21 TaxID=3092262 RepID=UPI002A6A6EF2|nr:glycosyltransferase family A protein [Pseudarthrobacter sp. IC2-21]